MTIGSVITSNRKRMNITQEALAQKLGVTNQAVSKWELDQACPDIQLLSVLADTFGITMDELFGRKRPGTLGNSDEGLALRERKTAPEEWSWEDDDTLRIVLYQGHRLLKHCPAEARLSFSYEGPALNIDSAITVNCGDVAGSVDAGGSVNCGNVGGDVDAGGSVTCGNVDGDVDAGGNVNIHTDSQL